MTAKLEDLLRKVGELLQKHLKTEDYETAAKLSPFLPRLESLRERQAQLGAEIEEIERSVEALSGDKILHRLMPFKVTPRKYPSTLKVVINWAANGKTGQSNEEICRHTAAKTLAGFLDRLIEEFGESAVQKLLKIRISRGPLLSANPERDFFNPIQGTLYAHKKLLSCNYHVLTHSSTAQKIKDLKRICDLLGFKKGSVRIEEVDRGEGLVSGLL